MSEHALRRDERELSPGTLVGGRFRIVRMRGQGGMGSVYEAEDPVIGRQVAVKLLRVTNRVAIERFEREARAASRISSRHVAAVHDFGRDPEHGLYMVMELLAGQTLDSVIAAQAPLPPSQVAAIGAEIAEALHAAHRAEVVHRDLKPSNVLVLAEGGLKVLDFGIARMLAPEPGAPDTTDPDSIIGTPRYMSPEAVEGSAVGPATDLYALGVVLYELVTGRAPFVDSVPAVLLTKHLQEVPPRLAEKCPGLALPQGFSDLVAQLLEKDPADRPPSARQVADALRTMSDDDGPVRLTSGVHATPEGLRRSRRRPWLLLGGAFVFLLVAAIALGVVLALYQAPSPSTVAAPLDEPEPIPAPPIAEPAPVETSVEITVTTEPASALLLLDGVEVRSPIQLPRDEREHVLTVEAAGYTSATRNVRADRDHSLEVVLRRAARRDRLPVKLRGW